MQSMIVTVDIADVGIARTVRTFARRPSPDDVTGLRWADAAALVPLATMRPPSLRRVALIAFWDDEDAAEGFRREHPVGRRFAAGLHATLRPIRAFGHWPGLAADIPDSRAVPSEGPVVVVTLGRLRLSQIFRFLRASRPAERAATEASGLLWGSAAARPPFLATISVWEDSRSAATYAYGRQRPPHNDAITAQQRKDFHRESAFIRCAPVHVDGQLDGTNPLSALAFA